MKHKKLKYFSREYIKENNLILIVFVVLLFIGFVVYAATGPRMHDQYWYLADVESLINGLGVQTNNIFPIEAI
ncbi:MAG: hypothetical protein KAH01_04930, partial [Caldisericia bacterium]|nr:hypothetical protein [Caldisericia bacterium]